MAGAATPEGSQSMSVNEVKSAVLGDWASIAPEIRPSAFKNPDGTLKPFYLTRAFKASPGDAFELTIVNFADPYGKAPLARIRIASTCSGAATTRSRPARRRSISWPTKPMRSRLFCRLSRTF
jgi:hypothetical protein